MPFIGYAFYWLCFFVVMFLGSDALTVSNFRENWYRWTSGQPPDAFHSDSFKTERAAARALTPHTFL